MTVTCDYALAFVNPDGAVADAPHNELGQPTDGLDAAYGRAFAVEMPPDSVGTPAVNPG